MKEFMKRLSKSFFVSHVMIAIIAGTVGTFLEPDTKFGYGAFYIPLLYAILCVIPEIAMYSKAELTMRQVVVRKVVQLVLIEGIVLFLFYISGSYNSMKEMIAIMLSVVIIYVTVQLIELVSEIRDTKILNQVLLQMREEA